MRVKIKKIHEESVYYSAREDLIGAVGKFELDECQVKIGKYKSGWFYPEHTIKYYDVLPVEELKFYFFAVQFEEIQ